LLETSHGWPQNKAVEPTGFAGGSPPNPFGSPDGVLDGQRN
jgi:hypothetical protein